MAFLVAAAPALAQTAARKPATAVEKFDARKARSCFGNEPFWNLTIRNDEVKFEHDGNVMEIRGVKATTAVGSSDTFIALYQGKVVGKERFMNVIIMQDGQCSDGASDRSYPGRVHVLSGKDLYTGCCK